MKTVTVSVYCTSTETSFRYWTKYAPRADESITWKGVTYIVKTVNHVIDDGSDEVLIEVTA